MPQRMDARIGSRLRPLIEAVRRAWHALVFRYLVRTMPARNGRRLLVAFLNEYSVPKTLASLLAMRRLAREDWDCRLAFRTAWLPRRGRPNDAIGDSLTFMKRNFCRLSDAAPAPLHEYDSRRETLN